jgi:hypothetical protein
MPVLDPVTGALQPTLCDLAPEVLVRTENRTTEQSRALVWLKEALEEIASNPDYRDEFDELEVLGTPLNLTPGVQEYDQALLVPQGDYNLATLDILLWIDPPTNTVRRKLLFTHFQHIDKFQPVSAMPTQWYRFGSAIGFSPIPDKAYQVQARLLRRHPITSDICNTVVLLPPDWYDIIVWSAVLRGYMELGEFEKAAAVRMLLYGDPRDPGKPGLILSRKRRREREAWRMEQGLRPLRRRYGWGF